MYDPEELGFGWNTQTVTTEVPEALRTNQDKAFKLCNGMRPGKRGWDCG